MARPERNNVDYFPHPVKHGKKMFYIRKKYKNDGYAAWNIILEHLGESDFHYLDLNEDMQLEYLSADIGIEETLLLNIIEDIVKIGDFDEELWSKERIVYDQKFTDSISDAYKKRTNKVICRESLITLLHSKGRIKWGNRSRKLSKSILKDSDNPQRIEEDSKGEYITQHSFYQKEFKKLESSDDRSLKNAYFRLVGTLFNSEGYENALNTPVEHILNIPYQLTLDEYMQLRDKAKKRGVSIPEKLKRIINKPGYASGVESLFLLLEDWIEREPIQGTNHG